MGVTGYVRQADKLIHEQQLGLLWCKHTRTRTRTHARTHARTSAQRLAYAHLYTRAQIRPLARTHA